MFLHLTLHSEAEASLRYTRTHFKTEPNHCSFQFLKQASGAAGGCHFQYQGFQSGVGVLREPPSCGNAWLI